MKRFISSALALSVLMLAGCGDEYAMLPDGAKFLSELEGPEISGVNDTLMQTAQEAEKNGNHHLAAQYYQQLSDSKPENKEFRVKLADAMRRLNDPNNALVQYEWVIKKDENYIPAREGRALAWMQLGDVDKAESEFDILMQSGKASWRTYNSLGIIRAGKQDPAQATAYFNKALSMSDNNPSVLNNMALALGMNRQFDSAFAMFAEASGAAASRPAAKKQIDLNSALVYAASGKIGNAEYIARQYLDGPALNNNLGFYALLAKDEQLAKTYLNMALTGSKTFYKRAWENLKMLEQPVSLAEKPEIPGKRIAIEDSAPAPDFSYGGTQILGTLKPAAGPIEEVPPAADASGKVDVEVTATTITPVDEFGNEGEPILREAVAAPVAPTTVKPLALPAPAPVPMQAMAPSAPEPVELTQPVVLQPKEIETAVVPKKEVQPAQPPLVQYVQPQPAPVERRAPEMNESVVSRVQQPAPAYELKAAMPAVSAEGVLLRKAQQQPLVQEEESANALPNVPLPSLSPSAAGVDGTLPTQSSPVPPYIPGYVPYTRHESAEEDEPVVIGQQEASPSAGGTKLITSSTPQQNAPSNGFEAFSDAVGGMLDW